MKMFKFSVVNGKKYLQIWEDGKFLMSCGHADKLYNDLVALSKYDEQTKELEVLKTKLLREAGIDF